MVKLSFNHPIKLFYSHCVHKNIEAGGMKNSACFVVPVLFRRIRRNYKPLSVGQAVRNTAIF